MKKLSADTTKPSKLGTYLKANSSAAPAPGHAHGPMSSMRKADYKGHSIEIETIYRISVDGEP